MKSIPCHNHKISDNYVINLINYCTHGWHSFREHRFLGFIPTHPDVVKCLEIEGTNYIACHVFHLDKIYAYGKKDDGKSCVKKPYILMFMGNDDLSYFLRFETRNKALEFFEKLDLLTLDIIKNCYMFN